MAEFFIADTHYGHNNILKMENRPFSTIDEMEYMMIGAWNLEVTDSDTVYIIGDFCFKGYDKWVYILSKLNGAKVLIKGNHDKATTITRLLNSGYLKEAHMVGEFIKRYNIDYYMTHYPLALGERGRVFNLHGHIHNQPSDYEDQINVGVDSDFMHNHYLVSDVPFGTPVSLDYIDAYVSNLSQELINKHYGNGLVTNG